MKENHNLFISTSAFPSMAIKAILDICLENNISGIELSSLSGKISIHDLSKIKKYYNDNCLAFLVHNYFPPPDNPFVLNLASSDIEILKRSREHCLKSIDLCSALKAPFYSVHSGFCFHASPSDLGKNQTMLPRVSLEKAESIFFESLHFICKYARDKGVDIAIENNVLAPFNVIDSKNELLLGVTSNEMLHLIEGIGVDNLFVLLDVGHLKVSAMSLGLELEKEIRLLAPYIVAVHLSENDGINDSNKPVAADSWFWTYLLEYLSSKVFYILEVYNLSVDSIIKQLQLSQYILNKDGYAIL